MSIYSIALMTHLSMIALSGGFFVLRGIWMMIGSTLLQAKPVRILPHIIDTLLLISAFVLAYQIRAYPFTDHWLTAKLLALVAYIVLGMFALKRAKTKQGRIVAFVAALAVFVYIVSVAFSKNPMGFLA